MISVRSLPPICVALSAADPNSLQRLALAECAAGAKFVELRLDLLPRPEAGLPLIKLLRERWPKLKILATCRRKEAQGGFAGSIEEQERILAKAASNGAQLLDLEIETAEPAPDVVGRLRQKGRVVVSFHDFEKAPSSEKVLKRLQKIPADLYKMAVAGVKPSDSGRLLRLLGQADAPPLVVLAMGEVGAASRILSPSRGAAFTFAAPNTAPGTAPGQYSAAVMQGLYRVDKLTRETRVFGVIASPVAHSMSPVLHNRALRKCAIDGVYLPFRVEPERLSDFFRFAEELPVEGFSVTLPHKEKVMRHLAGSDKLALQIGAVNTVFRKGRQWWGTNTDAIGVTAPLERLRRLKGATALVVGTGGAARAAVFGLKAKGARVAVTGRRHEKVRALAQATGAEGLVWDVAIQRGFDILVQSTPVGMSPNVEDNLFPDAIPAEIVLDMVYNPLRTALIKRAREQGKTVVLGLEMFIEQAAAQFELWTKLPAPRAVMRNAVLDVLQGV
jgi:3-dehydroquinate dehydratase/shikimate dehydrogenase